MGDDREPNLKGVEVKEETGKSLDTGKYVQFILTKGA